MPDDDAGFLIFSRRLATADKMAKNPVSLKLEEIGLEQYAPALIDDKGYDDLGALQGLTKHQAEEIADNVQMKPGHKRKPL